MTICKEKQFWKVFSKVGILNIKDIAKIAGTSISTVSKVVNGKDPTISEATRKKILAIVKEYNYSPYANVKRNNQQSYLLGLLVKKDVQPEFLQGLVDIAKKHGFGLVIHQESSSEEIREKFLLSLSNKNLDGLIWEETFQVARELADKYVKKNIPIRCFGINEYHGQKGEQFHIDFKQLGYLTTSSLIHKHHTKIGCLYHDKAKQSTSDFIEGYRNCLFDFGLKYSANNVQCVDASFSINNFLLLGVTSVVCMDELVAGTLYQQAIQKNLIVPRDLSIVSLAEHTPPQYFSNHIATINIGLFQFGYELGKNLIHEVEQKRGPFGFPPFTYDIQDDDAITAPSSLKSPRVLVVGSINMDTLMHTPELPCVGITAIAADCKNAMGGKGANQAVGIARLGLHVSLMARIGKDADGLRLHDALLKKHVNSEYLIFDEGIGTGRAYIYVLPNGESSITVYLGANSNLSRKDIDNQINAFEDVDYCLLQTEISTELVFYAAKLCKERGIVTILKPANMDRRYEDLLQYIDYFIPNEKEAEKLCDGHISIEQQAQYFIDKGVKNVIITLAERGCFYSNGTDFLYFSAMKFPVIDTTGAADAFIAAFTASLAKGVGLEKALKMASYAGSHSITQEGAQTAMLDKEDYENLLNTVGSLITVSRV